MPDKKRSIKIEFQQKPEKDVALAAYTVDRAGKVTGAVPVSGGKFDLPDLSQGDVARVLVGPAIPRGGARELPTMSMLQRMQAIEVPLRASASDILAIPEYPGIWLLCRCTIQGQVVREVGGHAHPVCHARVHVCEVDPWPYLILKLSDIAVRTIRADLLDIPIDVRPPIGPGPGPDPGPLAIVNPGMMRVATELNPQPLPPKSPVDLISIEQKASFRAATGNLPASLKNALSSDSPMQIRQALTAHFDWIAPLIWYWPWFWYSCEEIGVDETDDNGRFSLTTWYPCRGDKPDLYFWVEYFIAGSWTTVYHPPVRLSTHWNYPCGSEVTIRITDERVPFCDPDPNIPGKKLIVTTIGNNESVARIKRASAGTDRGLTFDGNPFGGQLEPHVDFGVGLSAANTASPIPFYYRWSYRKAGSGTFTPLDANVYRRYRVEPASGNPEYRSYQLGPFTIGTSDNLYRIRPKNVVDPDGPSEWVVLNMRDDTAGAYFLSHLLDSSNPVTAAGKYELLLELFNNTGALITDWAAAGIQGFIPDASVPAPFAPGITLTTELVTGSVALAEFDYKPAAASAGMIFTLHIDNNPCEAQIFAVTVPGAIADDNCGFYEYPHTGATVGVSFEAKHPNNFATFNFDIYKGASNFVGVASLPGPTRPPYSLRVGTTGNGFSFASGTFVYAKSGIAVHDMLGDCDKAAFSETLYVAAMATDGWGRLSGYDRAGIPRAFALAPQHP